MEEKRPADIFQDPAPQPRVDALLRLNNQAWLAIEVTRSNYLRDVKEGLWRLQNSGVARHLAGEGVNSSSK